jgi:hypothetical protein
MQTKEITPLVTDHRVNELIGTYMNQFHYNQVINSDFVGFKPDGTVGIMLVKQCIARYTWESALEFLRGVNGDPRNRGTAVAGKGAMMPRLRGDGTLSKRIAVPKSVMQLVAGKADNLGYFDYVDEADRRKVSCRQTNWTVSHPEILEGVLPYILEIDALFKACLPDEYAIQWAEVAKVAEAYRIAGTVVTTLTDNKDLRSFLHRDQGDLKKGMGIMATLGRFRGGYLVFPKFGLAIDYKPGDLLFADVHEAHGNCAFGGERLCTILYCRERMHECAAPGSRLIQP